LSAAERGTAQNGIEPGTIAAASKNTNPRFHPRKGTASFSDRPVDRQRPLIVKLPTLADERSPSPNRSLLPRITTMRWRGKMVAMSPFLITSAAAISRKNEALTSTSGLAGFDAIDAVGAEQIVGRFKRHALFATAVKEIRRSFAKHKSESSPCSSRTGESREIDCVEYGIGRSL